LKHIYFKGNLGPNAPTSHDTTRAVCFDCKTLTLLNKAGINERAKSDFTSVEKPLAGKRAIYVTLIQAIYFLEQFRASKHQQWKTSHYFTQLCQLSYLTSPPKVVGSWGWRVKYGLYNLFDASVAKK